MKSIPKIILLAIVFFHTVMASQLTENYLLKPTGRYGVSFKDFYWINSNLCPDPNFSKKNKKDFSKDNIKYCHELMVRIYYPTRFQEGIRAPYYPPIIDAEQNMLKAKHTIKLEDIEKLSRIKSYAVENAPVVKNIQFPVVLFISGLGGQAQLYENVITQLVSNGYIVVGINSVFVNGDIALPNKKIVSTIDVQNWGVVIKRTIPVLEQDISFVYKKIHDTKQDIIFKSMDLRHIGAVGHSFGGRAMANVANQHEKWFQALVTFDMEVHMGSFKPKNATPSMHIISAYWKSMFNWINLYYQLNKNGYLVTLSPTKNDSHYSYHMNYTDFSTLQYLPAYQTSMTYDRSRLAIEENVQVKNISKKIDKLNFTNRPLYLIIKNKNAWKVFYYEPGKTPVQISLENIPDLQSTLVNLSSLPLKKSEFMIIKKIIHAYHQGYGNYLGKGNGVQITKAINLYLVDFFNAFLKSKKNRLEGCAPLTNNTYMVCGPGIF